MTYQHEWRLAQKPIGIGRGFQCQKCKQWMTEKPSELCPGKIANQEAIGMEEI